jgi:hypothetical protein
MSNRIISPHGPTPTPPKRYITVLFELPAACAVLSGIAELDAMMHARLEGMSKGGDWPESLIAATQHEKSLRMQAYHAIVDAIKGQVEGEPGG